MINFNPAASIPNVNIQSVPSAPVASPQGMPFDKFLNTALQNKDLIASQMKSIADIGKGISPDQVAQYASQIVGADNTKKKQKVSFDQEFAMKQMDLLHKEPKSYLAQAVPDNLNQLEFPDNFGPLDIEEESYAPINPRSAFSTGISNETLNITPFQFFLDKSLEFLTRVTMMEIRTDSLMELYTQGKASLEELTIEKAKVSVAVSFATTVLGQITQAFKEIQNMQI